MVIKIPETPQNACRHEKQTSPSKGDGRRVEASTNQDKLESSGAASKSNEIKEYYKQNLNIHNL